MQGENHHMNRRKAVADKRGKKGKKKWTTVGWNSLWLTTQDLTLGHMLKLRQELALDMQT